MTKLSSCSLKFLVQTEEKNAQKIRENAAVDKTKSAYVIYEWPLSDYHNFSNHVEHYHGFNRKCNFPNCDVGSKSIQEFVQHHVRHTDQDFILPTEFKEKEKVPLTCPNCANTMNGIWRFYNHTFIHDSLQRFRCPQCNKRFAKVIF